MARRKKKPETQGRLFFDPDRLSAKKTPEESPTSKKSESEPKSSAVNPREPVTRITVSQLAAMIDGALKDRLPARVRVVGEVSNLNDRTHKYFLLKDAHAVVSCVMFASAARKSRFALEDGMEIVASGRIEHFPRQGRTQLYVDSAQPVGAGALDVQLRELSRKLRAEGLFDDSRKRALPVFPRRVAIITSRTGAALHDVLDTMKRRSPAVGALICDVRVQGDQAAGEIVGAIARINRERTDLGVDTIILTRGGGSLEDLWAFNEEAVVRAVADSALPTIAAIGHETDVTLAELAADVRAATPTQAAMRAVPDRDALTEQIERLASRLQAGLATRTARSNERLRALEQRPCFRRPAQLIFEKRQHLHQLHARLTARRPAAELARRHTRLTELSARLTRAARATLDHERLSMLARNLTRTRDSIMRFRLEQLAALDRSLRIASPESVLRRGYSITLDAHGNAIRSTSEVARDDHITTVLTDGEIRSRVDNVQEK